VHLVLPRREIFSRQRLDPSASIVLKMRGVTRLDRSQIQGIQHLVATAVSGLRPNRISIVDDRGTLLSRGGGADDQELAALNAEERRTTFERRLNKTLEQLLEPSVGIGNVRAEVRADMDFDRIVTNEEIFDPEGQVVRSTQSISEENQNAERDSGAVSVGQNLPDSGTPDNANKSQSTTNRTEEATNFEISKKISKHIRESGKIKALSVAVLVNDRVSEGEDGKINFEPRGQEELANMEVTGQAGGGMVSVIMNGQYAVKRVKIDPSLSDDIEMLEDLVAAAVNDAVRKVETTTQEKMSGIGAGLPLPPGMKLPF